LSRFLRICSQSSKKVQIWPKKFFFLKKSKKVSKNAEFHADFESVEKVLKKCTKKKLLAKTWRKNALFSLLLMFVKLVLLITFFWCIFSQLFQRIRNQREILRFLTHFRFKKKKIFLGHISTFFQLDAKRARNGSKNQKTYFLNVVVYFNIFLLSFLLLFGKKSVFAQNINRFGISIKFCVFWYLSWYKTNKKILKFLLTLF